MSIRTKSNLKGMKDIRTHSGRVDRVGVPYMAYMKISCLEMERARRERERRAAMSRINIIDSRLAEIDNEKDGLLVRLGERDQDKPRERKPGLRDPEPTGHQNEGFKIRY